MKQLVGCIAIFFSGLNPVFAQSLLPRLTFKPNDSTYVFGEQVNLRVDTSTTSTVITQLNVGEKVIITDQSTSTLTLNRRTEHWYKVRVPALKKEGYVWGGMLSIVTAEKDGLLFMISISQVMADDVEYEVRAVRKNKILHKIPIADFPCGDNGIGEFLMSGTVEDNHGLSGCQNVITFISTMETGMCDVIGSNTHQTILWNGKTMLPLPQIEHGYGDGCILGSFYGSYYIFPADPDGKPDLVLMHTLTGNCDEEDEIAYTKTITVQKVLIWDGKLFIQPKIKHPDED